MLCLFFFKKSWSISDHHLLFLARSPPVRLGGKWVANLARLSKAARSSLLVVSCAGAVAGNATAAASWREAAEQGPAGAIVTHACVYDAVMRKSLDTAQHHVEESSSK